MIDVKFEVGGWPLNPNTMKDRLTAEILKSIEAEIRKKIGSIRHPETSEFPVVVVRGRNLDNLSVEVTGPPELVALVKSRLSGDENESMGDTESTITRPVVFISYGSEDNELVDRLANDLLQARIEVFYAAWDIGPGDSIRQKIDEGLERCTHFIAVLTPTSIEKEWVKTEMDAGFMRKVAKLSKFIPLRVNLPTTKLPPLLGTMHSPSIDDYDKEIRQLIADIKGISRRPTPIPSPEPVTRTPGIGISAAAEAIVRLMIERSEFGDSSDPELTPDKIREETGLTDDDVIDAVHELEGQGFIRRHRSLNCGAIGFHGLWPESELFVKFDPFFTSWDAENDALRIAADLVNRDRDGVSVKNLAESYSWSPRRINPAVNYLINRKLVGHSESLFHPWASPWINRTPATRRFIKDRG